VRLPPRPKFDFYGMRQAPFDQIKRAPLAAKDFGLSGHLRLQQQRVIINLRGDEYGFFALLDELEEAAGSSETSRRYGVWHGAWTLVETKLTVP